MPLLLRAVPCGRLAGYVGSHIVVVDFDLDLVFGRLA